MVGSRLSGGTVGEAAPASRGLAILRRAGATWMVLTVALAAGSIVAAPARADLSSARIVRALNAQRTENGIPPVVDESRLGAGCAAYDRYVLRNGPGVADEHFEKPGLPGYTAAGNEAARTSVLADDVGPTRASIATFGWANGDPWNDAAFHLFQLMNPALAVSGGDERTAQFADGQWVTLECLSTFAGPWRVAPAKLRTYFYPGKGSTVPLLTPNQEDTPVLGIAPGASGPPLLFTYYFGRGVAHVHDTSIRATLAGKPWPSETVYVGGASGPGRTPANAASVPANPSANFYSPDPASISRMLEQERLDQRNKLSPNEALGWAIMIASDGTTGISFSLTGY